MKRILTVIVLIIAMVMAGTAAADVQTGWPMGTPNTHPDPHILIDFEDGTCGDEVASTNKITFENEVPNPWVYGCKICDPWHLNIYPNGVYVINGNCAAWCGIPGHSGDISFEHDVGHVSVLVSTWSGLYMDAYNSDDVLVAESGWAYPNLYRLNTDEPVMTRISVDRPAECDISYVRIHDGGNYWVIDDLLITRKRGEGGIAHCQWYINGQGEGLLNLPEHVTGRWPPCE